MRQAGGWVVNEDGTEVTADSAENLAGLTQAQKMLKAGSMKYAKEVDAGWGGEALGKGKAGHDHRGQLDPRRAHQGLPQHQGQGRRAARGPRPARARCCSATAGASPRSRKNQAAAVDLVKSLTTDRPADGVRQGVRRHAVDQGGQPSSTPQQFPDDAAFAAGGEYGQGPVNVPGFDPVMAAFNTDLEQLRTKDPKAILESLQKNGDAALKGSDPCTTDARPAAAGRFPAGGGTRERRRHGRAGCSPPPCSSSSGSSSSSRSLMALYVSLTSWNGNGSPFTGGKNAQFVGVDNYTVAVRRGRPDARQTSCSRIGNNFWFVFFVVPLQTALSFFLALIVNNKFLKGKSFFRTAFYFPSVTSSIAISVVFLFLFANSGAVNAVLGLARRRRPARGSATPAGCSTSLAGGVGVDKAPGFAQAEVFGRSLWDWFSGPSVAMCVVIILVVWTTTGTFMLMFLAALQDVPVEVEEAAMLDGTTGWQKLRHVTVPMLKPAFFLVTTLGLIGTWQVFDQIYVMGKGAPANTTLTPAFLSYKQSFTNSRLRHGRGDLVHRLRPDHRAHLRPALAPARP